MPCPFGNHPKPNCKPMKTYCLFLILFVSLGCSKSRNTDVSSLISSRPDQDGAVYDYVGLMKDVSESTNRYLASIRDNYGIEVLIVALPGLPRNMEVNDAAAQMYSNWHIGRDVQGRGLLVLLVDDEKQVKVEVGSELEDVFTDLFTGHIENEQLQLYYDSGALETGLTAMLEEIESRAQVKFRGGYSFSDITLMDHQFLSQGGGARQDLEINTSERAFSGMVNKDYPAGTSPDEAWQTMIRAWHDKVRDPYLGVYTATGRLSYRDYTTVSDSYLEKQYMTYANKPYTILQHGRFAVVSFGNIEGWDNSPFLLCETSEGWQFDLVHQRRFIRMGKAPHWGVEFSDHPHMALLMDSFQFQGQDIPVEGIGHYTIDRDVDIANGILEKEEAYKTRPEDFETIYDLGRLYTLAAMSRKAIAVLNQAIKLSPDDPRPYPYLAVAHVDAHYQYDTALSLLTTYMKLKKDDPFALAFSGYILYQKKTYGAAADAFEKVLSQDPDNGYAHFYLAYIYAALYDHAKALDPRRKIYENKFHNHVKRLKNLEETYPLRVQKLNGWLNS